MPEANNKEASYRATPKKKVKTKKTPQRVVDLGAAREAKSKKQTGDAKVELAEALGLAPAGITVTSIRCVGRGGNASADIALSNGAVIEAPTLHQFAKLPWLHVELSMAGAVEASPDKARAMKALGLIRRIADWEETASDDDTAREWGVSFLQEAPAPLTVDMSSQPQRWEALKKVEEADPIRGSRQGKALSRTSIVVADELTGTRFVRCGWFQIYVREAGNRLDAAGVNNRMARVGWKRPNSQGRVKATNPRRAETVNISFYEVPEGWEDA